MNQHEFDLLLKNRAFIEEKLNEFKKKEILQKQPINENEILGHLAKAKHNLNFVYDNLKLGYLDWCLTGCYYAAYQAALALLLKKGYASKNHNATLLILIKDYYRYGVDKEDLFLIEQLYFDYQDLLFYVESKTEREKASYSTIRNFDKNLIEALRIKSMLFVDKAIEISGVKLNMV